MSSKPKDYDFLFKIVLIGDSGVGKSCLLLRFADQSFTETFISTIGVDFRFRTIKVEKKTAKLQIWDTAGQERFKTITSAYYRGADGIIIVYDVGNKDSFRHINDWLNEVSRYAPENAVKLVVGHKCDLPEKIITTDSAKDFTQSLGIFFIEASSKTGENVDQAFSLITSELMKRKADPRGYSSASSVARLSEGNKESKAKKSCC